MIEPELETMETYFDKVMKCVNQAVLSFIEKNTNIIEHRQAVTWCVFLTWKSNCFCLTYQNVKLVNGIYVSGKIMVKQWCNKYKNINCTNKI